MRTLVLLTCLLLPHPAWAQAAIAGVVTDPTGASIPGVTVEAFSTALIENVRSTITDGAGRYRIEDLPPGTYDLHYTLTGWRTSQTIGVELAGSFAGTVDVQLAVGDVAETLVVGAEPPVVGISSARRALSLPGSLLQSLPSGRSYSSVLLLIPGVVTNAIDAAAGAAATFIVFHGGRQNEGRLFVAGLPIGSAPSGNSPTAYHVDSGQSQEVTVTTSGNLGEAETAGVTMNIVPQAGGNQLSGGMFGRGSAKGLQSSNLTPELLASGVIAPAPYLRLFDLAGTAGGPIRKERLWYSVGAHTGSNTKESTTVYYNLNAGIATKWDYAPDKTRRAYSDRTVEDARVRLTWQATPRNKLAGFWDWQALCRACTGATAGLSEPQVVSPEAVGVLGRRLDVTQVAWSSPLNNRWLLEAGYGGVFFGVGNFEREPNPTRGLIRVVEQCASGCAANGGIPGLTYRSQDFSVAHTGSYLWKGAASYVTGTHALKIGYQHTLMTDDRTWFTNDHALTYRLDNGRPNQLTQSISPWMNNARASWDAVFVQEQWTWNVLTVEAALRFDQARSWFPAQQQGPARFLPTPLVVPATRGVDSYRDLSPRFGMAYDVGGAGRTALTLSLGRYLESVGASGIYANTNPTLRMPQTTPAFGTAGVTRAWTDSNSNFVPDCDLMNSAAQDLRASGGDACGVLSNVNFGTPVLTNAFAPEILSGWGVRPSDWSLALSLQQALGQRASASVTYSRRTFAGFTVVDNLSWQPSDLTPFSITAPHDPRLPGGGGYIIAGFYDVVPAAAGKIDNLVTDASQYGGWSHYFNGVDVTVDARLGQRLSAVGGVSTGQVVADNCEVRARLPELSTTTLGTSAFGSGLATTPVSPLSPYCHAAYGVLTQARGAAVYQVPRVDVTVSATLQSRPGPLLAANYAARSADIVPSLGRPLSASAPNVTINLIAPGSLYGRRISQMDVRLAKILRNGSLRMVVGLDVFNALNANAVLTYNQTFVPDGPWLQPLTLQGPRMFQLTAEVDW